MLLVFWWRATYDRPKNVQSSGWLNKKKKAEEKKSAGGSR